MFDIAFNIHNIRVEEVTFDPSATVFKISKNKPNFEIELADCNFNIAFNYSIVTTPELVQDYGFGKGWMRNLNITLQGSPQAKDGTIQFEFDDINVGINDFGIDIQGGDLSILVNFFEDNIKGYIRSYLLGQMSKHTRAALQGLVNQLLMTMP